MATTLVDPADLSVLEQLALLPDEEQAEVLRYVTGADAELFLSWKSIARPSQLPPTDSDWFAWFYMAGRGAGKTRSAAEATLDQIAGVLASSPGSEVRWAVVAPTFGDMRDVCVEGESGLLACLDRRGERYEWNRSHGELTGDRWIVQGYSAEKPDRLRGPQFHGAWFDEPGAYREGMEVLDRATPALRLGRHPHLLVTGTPKLTRLIRHLVGLARSNPLRYRLVQSTTWRNRANLPDVTLEILDATYGGTRMGRQELGGELLEEAEGALWTLDVIDECRVPVPSAGQDDASPVLDLGAVADALGCPDRVVAVDPAGGSTAAADETGIVGACSTKGRVPHAYVLADRSGRFAPEVWARRALELAFEIRAPVIVAERNYGGDLVKRNIEAAMRPGDPYVAVRMISAKKEKRVRAEPVATLYGVRRVHHVGTFGDLEGQMVTWVQGEPTETGDSPDRIDALVYAVLQLIGGSLPGAGASLFTGSVSGR